MIVALALLSAGGQVVRYTIDGGTYRWYVGLFDLNREQNLPTFVQGIMLMSCAVLLGVITLRKWTAGGSFRRSWAMLTVGFAALSFDEVCSIHEQMLLLTARAGFSAEGVFRFAWVIPGMAIVVCVGTFFGWFIAHLASPIRRRFILSGALYIAGVLGMEMVGGWYSERYGENILSYQLLTNIEEVMEMTGIAIFMVALLRYIAGQIPTMSLQMVPETEPSKLWSTATTRPQAVLPAPLPASHRSLPSSA